MKATLASATSLAALLVFQAGPAQAGPLFDLSATTLNFGDILVGHSATTAMTVTATYAASSGTVAGSFAKAAAPFSGAAKNFSITSGQTATSNGYGFTSTGAGVTGSETWTTTVVVSGKDGTATQTTNVTLTAVGVAPIETVQGVANNATITDNVLVGTTGTATVTVQNVGHGNLAGPDSQTFKSNLHGTVGAGSSVIVGSGGTVNLKDAQSAAFNYTYSATHKGDTASTTVTSSFTDGSPLGSNDSFTNHTTIIANAVAPIENGMTGGNAGNVLVGGSGTAAVTVANSGNGNLSGKGSISNLNGSIAPSSSPPFSLSGSNSVSVPDTSSATFNYVYTPTKRGSNSTTVTGSFTDGSKDGKNTGGFTDSAVISGTGVAPVEAGMTGGNAKYVLVGTSGSVSVTVANSGDGNKSGLVGISNLNGSLAPTSAAPFSLSGSNAISVTDTSSQAFTYIYTPTKRGANSTTVTGTFSNGSKDNTNSGGYTDTAVVSGQGVAPVNSVTTTGTLARFNTKGVAGSNGTTSSSAVVTVTNTGDGNLATGGPSPLSNLNGSLSGPGSSVFTGPASGSPFSIPDGKTSSVTYVYAPTARGADSTGVTAVFSNGSANGMNQAQNVNTTISGQGVGPTYNSSLGTTAALAHTAMLASSYNTPVPNTGTSAIKFGTVAAFSTHTLFLDIADTSTDPNGGNTLLTDLSLEHFSITGPEATAYSIPAGYVPTVLHEFNGTNDIVVPITFQSAGSGNYLADLTFFTDQSVGFGAIGDSFTYALSGNVVPEPASLLFLSAGLGGVFFVRRRRPG